MQYYTPSTPAIERSPPVPGNTPTLVCLSCGDTMEHLRTIPNLERVGKSSSSSALPAKRSIQRK